MISVDRIELGEIKHHTILDGPGYIQMKNQLSDDLMKVEAEREQ